MTCGAAPLVVCNCEDYNAQMGGMGRRTRMPVLFPCRKKHGHRSTAAHATQIDVEMSMKLPLSRRRFLKTSAAALAAAAGCNSRNSKTTTVENDRTPDIVPSSAIGNEQTPPPSQRINVGFIGIGNMGSGHLNSFVNNREVQLLAMCDVREEVRNRTKKQVEETYANVFDKGSYSGCST